ncbi:MAG: DNA alkylation repair protein [Planctomycetota bacterium]
MSDIAEFVATRLAALADAEKAPVMAAYMKTDQPFYGVQKPDRMPVFREMLKQFKATTAAQYKKRVLALWRLPHREEQYAAIHYAMKHKPFITSQMLPLYERLLREGQWWDLVDPVAVDLVGAALLGDKKEVQPIIDQWLDDDDMWIRRTALICQLKHKEKTDQRRLFRYCTKRADETEFFIRKAIGWALRQYSYAAPDAVAEYLTKKQKQLSGLSYREGAKQLRKIGYEL